MNWKLIYESLIKRALLEEFKGDNYHKHHILQRYRNGSDDKSNLVLLPIKYHAMAHYILWRIYNNKRDLLAYYILSKHEDYYNKHKKLLASIGGEVQGRINAETNHINDIKTPESLSKGGKMAAEVCRRDKKNAFFNEELRLISCSRGGKTQGKINAENGHLKRITKLSNRTKGMIWVNDGIDKIFMVQPDDNRLKTGELVKGRKINKN